MPTFAFERPRRPDVQDLLGDFLVRHLRDVAPVWPHAGSGLGRRGYPYEVCDAVEGHAWAYEIDGVRVSDFVLPSYFAGAAPGPYDFGGHLQAGCPALMPGGYIGEYDPALGTWRQVLGSLAHRPADEDLLALLDRLLHPQVGTRRWRREHPAVSGSEATVAPREAA